MCSELEEDGEQNAAVGKYKQEILNAGNKHASHVVHTVREGGKGAI